MKVALFANSNLWLQPYHDVFVSKNHDVYWATYEAHIYEELLRRDFSNIVYFPDPSYYDEVTQKFTYSSPGKAENYFLSQINPDVVITDVSNRLSTLVDSKSCLWVQAFHSFCYKRYNFHDSLSHYDLLLLPGNYHRNAYLQRMSLLICESQLAVTGFPKWTFCPSHLPLIKFI